MRVELFSLLMVVAACAHPPAAPMSVVPDPLVVQLESERRAEPDRGAIVYALAMRNDRLGNAAEAVRWLDVLAGMTWDAGLDVADFATSRAALPGRFAAARVAVERGWRQAPRARELLRVGERDLLPEGMERLPGGELLLSSGRKRKVVAIAADGIARDLLAPAQDGLLATLGMRIDGARGLLWVASAAAPFMERADEVPAGTSRLHAFALPTGRLHARYELAGPSLLNDVAVLPDGRAVVTDSAADALWVTADGRLEPLLPAGTLSGPNGVATSASGELLYVASWRGIVVVDWRARRAAPLGLPPGATDLAGIDGLYVHGGGLVGIQNAVGRPRVVKVALAADGRSATAITIVESGAAVVDNPTTGVIVGDDLIFLARRNREHAFMGEGTPVLEDIVIATVRITDG
jgi:sugar lactone lactonase YvrE